MTHSAENDAPEYVHPGVSYVCRWRGGWWGENGGWFYRDSAGYEHACVRTHLKPKPNERHVIPPERTDPS